MKASLKVVEVINCRIFHKDHLLKQRDKETTLSSDSYVQLIASKKSQITV